jgi:hypothetical protein
VVVVVLVLAAGVYYVYPWSKGSPASPVVTVVGVEWSVNYTGSAQGYFGTGEEQACGGCPWHMPTGLVLPYWMNVTNGDRNSTHEITAVTVASPFVRGSVSPSLPISVRPLQTLKVYVNITFPSSAGTYEISGTLTTS